MKKGILVFVLSALALTAATTASARVDVSIGIAPFGIGYAPPVVYQPEPYYQPYYEPAPAVYIGGGYWGGRGYDGDRREHRDRGRGNRDRGHGGGHH